MKKRVFTIDSLLREVGYNSMSPSRISVVFVDNTLYEGGYYGCERVKRYTIKGHILEIYTH